MGDDFPCVPVFRIYLVRQWIHARGCCGRLVLPVTMHLALCFSKAAGARLVSC